MRVIPHAVVAATTAHCGSAFVVTSSPFLSSPKVRQSPYRYIFPNFASTLSIEIDSPGVSSTTQANMEQTKKLPYSWKDQWYALTFASYVPNPSETAEAIPASVFDHPLVLWKAEDEGEIYCADDVCPHRSAALSEGRVRDGKIECLYHGWQFQGQNTADDKPAGSCTLIPQLKKGATIPKRACLKMRDLRVVEGIVWVWMGDSVPSKDVPRQDDGLDELTGKREGSIVNDFQIDLPYDHSYLVENLIDPAHIPISHDKTPGGGKRELAEAYEMIVDRDSVSSTGFTGRYRTESQKEKDGPYIEVQFQAPGIIRQRGEPRPGIKFGAALHCMPLGLGRSRLMFRAYFTGLPKFAMMLLSLRPKFLQDLNSCKVLEQDVGLITTQEDHFARNPDRQLANDFLLLKSSDLFVEEYRKWMDKVGNGMPWYQGLASRSTNVSNHLSGAERPPALDPANHRASNEALTETRYHRHVLRCPNTRKALVRVKLFKKIFMTTTIFAITMASTVSSMMIGGCENIALKRALRWFLVPAIPLSSLIVAGLHKLEKQFYFSFKRKDQLRSESGLDL